DSAVEWEPGNALWWTKRGDAALGMGRLELAHESFAMAVRLVPASGFHWHNLGQAQDAKQQAADAAAFDTALRIDPNNAYFSLDATRFALQGRDGPRARRYPEDGIKADPNF